MSTQTKHKNHHNHKKHHHGKKKKDHQKKDCHGENGCGEDRKLPREEVDQLRDILESWALPILLGNDSIEWQRHSEDSTLENGIIWSCKHNEYGIVYKVEFVLDCPVDLMVKSIVHDLDIDWIPHIGESHLLEKGADYCVLQQRIEGVTAVSDRDFIFIQINGEKPNRNGQMTSYSMTVSVPGAEDRYTSRITKDCVRYVNLSVQLLT